MLPVLKVTARLFLEEAFYKLAACASNIVHVTCSGLWPLMLWLPLLCHINIVRIPFHTLALLTLNMCRAHRHCTTCRRRPRRARSHPSATYTLHASTQGEVTVQVKSSTEAGALTAAGAAGGASGARIQSFGSMKVHHSSGEGAQHSCPQVLHAQVRRRKE